MIGPVPSRWTSRRHRTLLSVLALACVGLGVAWSTDAVARAERTTETVPAEGWREEAQLVYSVPVLDGTPGFPDGTVLPMGEPGYLSTVSPRANLTFRWRVVEPSDVPAQGVLRLEAVLDATSPEGRALWTLREALAETPLQGRADATAEGVLDLPALEARIEREILATGQPRGDVAWRLEARVAFTAALPGESEAAHESVYPIPFSYSTPLYVLPDAEEATWSRAHGEPTVLVHETRAGPEGLLRAPHAPLLALAGLAALVHLWREGPLPTPAAPGSRQATLDEVEP